jgi:hypothetical protein
MNLKGCCDDESKSQYCYSYILWCAEVPIFANYLVVSLLHLQVPRPQAAADSTAEVLCQSETVSARERLADRP